MDSKKRDTATAEWISRPFKPTSHNEDEEDEEKEEDVGAPLSLTQDRSPFDKDNEGCEDDQEDDSIYDHEDTVIYDEEDNEEEASSGNEGESSLSKSSESSDGEDKEEDGTGAKEINGNKDSGGGVERNTGAGGRSA